MLGGGRQNPHLPGKKGGAGLLLTHILNNTDVLPPKLSDIPT